MFLPKVATFALHDPAGDCLVTGFCEARYSLRSGNAPQKLASEGSRSRPRESINHRSLSTSFSFIAGVICVTGDGTERVGYGILYREEDGGRAALFDRRSVIYL